MITIYELAARLKVSTGTVTELAREAGALGGWTTGPVSPTGTEIADVYVKRIADAVARLSASERAA